MTLKMFEFIEDSINLLEENTPFLETVRVEIEEYFNKILKGSCEGFTNINSRVKSSGSLKEKVLRNDYYRRELTPQDMLDNLSDLIGLRLECRFIKDEEEIYKILKAHFKLLNSNDSKISIDITSDQPQNQKNGFEIYRIDGIWKVNNKKIPFEVQIKSLVNIFWGEIEHKIIYKNSSYMMIDSFIKDIMSSIKKNLTMIDYQLFITYNEFSKSENQVGIGKTNKFEKLLSKIIYDAYALKMDNSIGFVVDFKKPCDTIMRYFLRDEEKQYSDKMIKILERLNEINSIDTKFDEEISLERDIYFNDEFSEIVGTMILESINYEFQWNLFFRIIFEIEPGNNAEDLEGFIKFFRDSFLKGEGLLKLNSIFDKKEANIITKDIMKVVANCFIEVKSIKYIIGSNIEEINTKIIDIVEKIYEDNLTYDIWDKSKNTYLKLLYINILSIFDLLIPTYELDESIIK